MKKEFELEIKGKPENYSRERKGKYGFYNSKSKQMREFRNQVFSLLSFEDRKFLKEFLQKEENFYVEIIAEYYLPIPKADSKKTKKEKEEKRILPNKIPDIDNLVKFNLDSLHEVFYLDDKVVTSISAKKFYSENPRTKLNVILFS